MRITTSLVGAAAMLLAASFLPARANTFFTGKKLTIQGTIHQSEDSGTGAPGESPSRGCAQNLLALRCGGEEKVRHESQR